MHLRLWIAMKIADTLEFPSKTRREFDSCYVVRAGGVAESRINLARGVDPFAIVYPQTEIGSAAPQRGRVLVCLGNVAGRRVCPSRKKIPGVHNVRRRGSSGFAPI